MSACGLTHAGTTDFSSRRIFFDWPFFLIRWRAPLNLCNVFAGLSSDWRREPGSHFPLSQTEIGFELTPKEVIIKHFRLTNVGLLLAVMIALGAVAGMAQNPCEDAAGQTAASDAVRADFAVKTLEGRKKFVETAKAFVEKYGACDPAKELADWAKGMIPKTEETIKKMEADKKEADLVARFNTALKAKNWDELYASGKVLLTDYGEKYRFVEIALGFIGLEETAKTPRVTNT